jgi:hypothetical protein
MGIALSRTCAWETEKLNSDITIIFMLYKTFIHSPTAQVQKSFSSIDKWYKTAKQ